MRRARLTVLLFTVACGGSSADPDGAPGGADAPVVSVLDAAGDAGCLSTACQLEERCFDGIDNDCDATIDEGCGCVPGSTTRCLPPDAEVGASICAWGEMTCVDSGEFGGAWSTCVPPAGGAGGATAYGCRRIGIMGAPGANPSANFQTWLETQGAIATRFHADAAAPTLQLAELETFDLVVVDWLQRLYLEAESQTLTDWVTAGGALLVMTGHDSGTTADRHESLIATLGPHYDLAGGPLNGPAVLLDHPLTRDGLGQVLPPVTFQGGLRTIVPSELAAAIVPIAEIGGATVGVAGPLGDGQVLLFGDEWIEFDSEWADMPAIPTLWANMVTTLTPDDSLGIPVCE